MHHDILHLLKEELENTLIRHKLREIREVQSLHDMEAPKKETPAQEHSECVPVASSPTKANALREETI
jgi:predicted nuclease with TOPRIM domain